MKHVLPLILIIHGLIHLIGFFRKSHPVGINKATDPNTIALAKNAALIANISLVVCLFLIAAAISYYIDRAWWLIIAIIALILSQFIIILYWNDAKWGTLVNIIILVSIIIGFAHRGFDAMVKSEVGLLYEDAKTYPKTIITKEMITGLPVPVKTWLTNAGIVGREKVHAVHLKQNGFMRSKPGEKNWTSMRAEQYVNIEQPSFIWEAKMNMNPAIAIRARDKYMSGRGEMKIKILSVIPIANSRGTEIDQGSLQRWLAEICWFPSAALSPHIRWEYIDDQSAMATMTYQGISGSAIFHFNKAGDIMSCTADRYMSVGNKMSLEKWEVKNTEHAVLNGVRIPVKSEAIWKLKNGDFTWLKLEITEIDYNKT